MSQLMKKVSVCTASCHKIKIVLCNVHVTGSEVEHDFDTDRNVQD